MPDDYKKVLKNVNYEGSACKINLVLNDIPKFKSLAHMNDQAKSANTMKQKIDLYKNYLQGTTHINSEHMRDIHDSYLDAMNGEICKRPMVEMVIPQILDPSLNKNNDENLVCSLFVQYAPTKL